MEIKFQSQIGIEKVRQCILTTHTLQIQVCPFSPFCKPMLSLIKCENEMTVALSGMPTNLMVPKLNAFIFHIHYNFRGQK